jgi:hypothetical protein
MDTDNPERAAQPLTFSRRSVVKALGTGVGAIAIWPYLSDSAAEALAVIQATQAPPSLKFLTAAQYRTVEALSETLIPAEDHSPGAKAARVADYIDLLLFESDKQTQQTWTAGLTALDAESRRLFKVPYVRLTEAQATEVLTPLAKNEAEPKTRLEQFFGATKEATIHGFYTSEIGIHQDLQYQGNRVLAEFVGCSHPEHGYEPGK